jgi:hypothetical protein
VPYERDPILKEDDIIVVRSGAYTADSAIIPAEFDGAITGYIAEPGGFIYSSEDVNSKSFFGGDKFFSTVIKS